MSAVHKTKPGHVPDLTVTFSAAILFLELKDKRLLAAASRAIAWEGVRFIFRSTPYNSV